MKPYRAIPIDGKDFVYGWYFYERGYNEHFILDPHFHADPRFNSVSGHIRVILETVGQQIGLQDKNSKEIYIGDKYKWYQPLVKKGKQTLEEHISIVVDEITELYYLHNRAEGCWGGVEIIGNVHQPELLEKVEKSQQ